MRNLFLFLILGLLIVNTNYAQKYNNVIIDTKTNKEILYGKCNIEGFKKTEFAEIYKIEYKYYIPDSNILIKIKPLLKKIRFHITMGSWCGDSQQQIPRFIKLLDKLNYKTKKIDILAIDHFFKAKNFEKGTNKIERVPTIIVYRKGKEIGRIVETPVETLEKDLLKILSDTNSK